MAHFIGMRTTFTSSSGAGHGYLWASIVSIDSSGGEMKALKVKDKFCREDNKSYVTLRYAERCHSLAGSVSLTIPRPPSSSFPEITPA